jgi:D-alanine-D-alanine ligase-like ATP-grasp enzyme
MFRFLLIASAADLEGAGSVQDLCEQIAFIEPLGIQTELLIDPPQAALEMAILSEHFDCAFSPISRCYQTLDNGQVVPRDYDIYAILERLDQPFIGSAYFRSMLVDDKSLANARYGLAPPGLVVTRALLMHAPDFILTRLSALTFPAIVKPNALGGSLGIDSDAITVTPNATLGRLQFLFRRFESVRELRVESYIAGAREFTVAVLGSGSAMATSVTEIVKPHPDSDVYGETDKRTGIERRRIGYRSVSDGVLRGTLCMLATNTFKCFGLRDLARFDILLKERFYVIDINVPPVLSNSFSYEWQILYGTRKRELLAYALAAFHYRAVRESGSSGVPMPAISAVPRPIRQALSPLAATEP